eukprot:2326018-Amphidinium_carterae.1
MPNPYRRKAFKGFKPHSFHSSWNGFGSKVSESSVLFCVCFDGNKDARNTDNHEQLLIVARRCIPLVTWIKCCASAFCMSPGKSPTISA